MSLAINVLKTNYSTPSYTLPQHKD